MARNSSKKTALIIPEGFEQFNYGPSHPLQWDRVSYAMDLISAYRLTSLEGMRSVVPEPASVDDVLSYHDKKYIAALKEANDGVMRDHFLSYNMGTGDNPVFPGLFDFSLMVTGCTLTAAEIVLKKEASRAFNMTGGMHHAMKASASGFCFINDIVLAIHLFLKKRMRVLYVDIDAHHGDGVQAAFYDTDRVLTLSFHESGRSLFPGTGFTDELGEGKGRGYSVNVPLRYGCDDSTFIWAFDEIFIPIVEKFKPDIVVSLVGCDMMLTDPLSNMNLTSEGYTHAVTRMGEYAKDWLVLGGGGYNQFNTSRLWTLVWACMNGETLPNELPKDYDKLARDNGFDLPGLRDEPYRVGEWRKQDILVEAQRSVREIKRDVFPLLKIKVKKGFFDDLFM
jgi:acetoin utilization protein AcuC